MTVLSWILGLALLIGIVAVVLSWTAGRLDRMHIRLATAQASLDRQLVDRCATVREVAVSGVLDPARALLLVEAADEARTAAAEEQLAAESELSRLLRVVVGDAEAAQEVWDRADDGQRELLADLVAASERVRYAHRFYNDLVDRTQRFRRRIVVRLFRLAGHAPWPQPFRIDDAPPEGMARAVAQSASGRS